MKAVHMDLWSIKEKLCLASAVVQEGEQDWSAVSRLLQPFLEPNRPPDWFSESNCALQYNALLEKVEVPRRKKRSGPDKGDAKIESPGEIIKKKLTDERIEELKRLMQLEKEQYLKDKEEIVLINCGYLDDQLPVMWAEIQEEKQQKEHKAKLHAQWLKEREERQRKIETEQEWKPPIVMGRVQEKMQSLQRRRKAQRAGRRRNSSPSSPSSEPDSTTVDSPLPPDLLRMDVLREESVDPQPKVRVLAPVSSAPTPSSPLLTSLLKSPSPAPSSQASILHSAITAQRGASPTIASLLGSAPGAVPPPPSAVSPSLKNLVSSAIAHASEEQLKPQGTSPSAGAPTLSMLLELPPSLPGKPLPELPSVARQPAPQPIQAPQTPSMPPAPPAPPAQPLPTPPPPPPPPPPRPSTTPAQEVLQTEQETDKDEEDDGELVEVKFEDLKETVQCDELTDEAVLEMVLATEDIVCTEPANVTIASGAVDVKGSWVRALDFGNEVKEQYEEVGSQNVQKHDGKIIVAMHEQVISEPVKETSPEEKNVEDAPETAESDHQVNEEVLVEVIDAEGEKEDNGVVGSEVEVATKGEQDLTEGYAVNGAEPSGMVVADMEQEVFNIQEVEVPMSETVAEVVEIMGDESQSELLAPVMGDISEQQVLEVIVGPALPASSPDPAVELAEKQDDVKGGDKDKHTDEESDEEVLSSDVNKKVREVIVNDVEASRLSETPDTKLELVPEKSELGTEESKNGFDSEAAETGKQSGKQKTDDDDKVRYRKKKHSKGKKKKHSREKRNDSKSRSKEIDSKTDSKSSEKKEVEKNAEDVTKDKVKNDGKIGVKKKDDKTEIIVQKKEVAKEEKKGIIREVSPEQVKTSKEGKNMSDLIQKNRSGKEDGKQTKNLNIDKKEKEPMKEMKPVSNETDSSRDKLLNSKESSKKDKGSVIEKPYRGHRKGQDVKNEDVPAKEEVPRKDKKDKKDVAHKKSDKSSDSEGGTGSGFLKEPTPAPTDEEDEKPLAEIADEKKLQLVSNILAKEERPARGAEPQSGEDDKASDAEPSRVASKKQRAAASTPIDSVPNSPAASFTTDEEREHKAWKKAIMLLYNRLATHKYASLFLRPITNDLAPGYSSYIYRPIDLQMIKKNIETGVIRTTTEFQKEVMRMFKNAIMYNKSLHDVHLMALEMQEECLQHIEEFVATQMLVASVGETPTRRETRTWDANKQREFLRSPRPSSQEDAEPTKPSKRKRNDTSSETPDHTPKRKTAED
ncbi:bromodomain-containing protein 8 isoform X2 [Bacillus rossius redtenbacheri]|uniref:bromodomain-containing protein 8 isoform X2 n=1 Tax=Bacillus rossius redtenbacheri TaxID=93214 RepID=UPI002FDED1F5